MSMTPEERAARTAEMNQAIRTRHVPDPLRSTPEHPTARLTVHQHEVLHRLVRRYLTLHHPVPLSVVGSAGALEHLTRKGFVHTHVNYGPRGGVLLSYVPLFDGARNRVAS